MHYNPKNVNATVQLPLLPGIGAIYPSNTLQVTEDDHHGFFTYLKLKPDDFKQFVAISR